MQHCALKLPGDNLIHMQQAALPAQIRYLKCLVVYWFNYTVQMGT